MGNKYIVQSSLFEIKKKVHNLGIIFPRGERAAWAEFEAAMNSFAVRAGSGLE